MIINREFLEQVRKELGDDWRVVEPTHDWQTEPDRLQSDNRILRFRTSNMAVDQGKVLISGIYPHGSKVNQSLIRVSYDRGFGAIAKSIEKRLLPDYESNLITAEKQIEKANDYERRKEKTTKDIAEAMGARYRVHGEDHFIQNIKEVYTRARVNSPTSVRLELDLDNSKAVKVIEFLKTL